jgi:hypothetical protein
MNVIRAKNAWPSVEFHTLNSTAKESDQLHQHYDPRYLALARCAFSLSSFLRRREDGTCRTEAALMFWLDKQ